MPEGNAGDDEEVDDGFTDVPELDAADDLVDQIAVELDQTNAVLDQKDEALRDIPADLPAGSDRVITQQPADGVPKTWKEVGIRLVWRWLNPGNLIAITVLILFGLVFGQMMDAAGNDWDRRLLLYDGLLVFVGAAIGAVFGVGVTTPRVSEARKDLEGAKNELKRKQNSLIRAEKDLTAAETTTVQLASTIGGRSTMVVRGGGDSPASAAAEAALEEIRRRRENRHGG